ncbi:MAG: hypothetical protein AVDCRST_MAG87-3474 [uncultured Thermomicrobiales bacterium]|uniref:Aminoglycoside phosphotransferase domain-containing protein n=1 Tax=uncultured Thermomicrobiales bacterium TaxID=1645740 RepID=A0A6J4VKL4_9BACT|nr:MAG: hypothetical protein AVDCRST_MAG87-3474 [uncultured Thermomicrobiales bacterium]
MTDSMSQDDERSRRLVVVLESAGLEPLGPLTGVESYSNDTWMLDDRRFGEVVLRICYRGDVERLPREAIVGRAIPPEVGYPEVLGSGETFMGDDRLTWSLARRLRGSTLLEAWPSLPDRERRRASRSTARALRAMHAWRPPDRLIADLSWPVPEQLTTRKGVIGASIHPVPIARVRVLIAELATVQGVDASLVAAATAAIERLGHHAPAFDDPGTSNLIHGDLQLSNIWWNDDGETGLIDLEWLRFAPSWVDLARLQDNADADAAEGLTMHADLLEWLREDYPELFAVDGLEDRIRFLCLAFFVRQALIWPSPSPAEPLAPDHPLRLLAQLV